MYISVTPILKAACCLMQIFKSINRLFSVLLLLCKTCIFIKMLNTSCPNYSKYFRAVICQIKVKGLLAAFKR